MEPQPFTVEDVAKNGLLVPHTYFGWSSEDVDMQVRGQTRGYRCLHASRLRVWREIKLEGDGEWGLG